MADTVKTVQLTHRSGATVTVPESKADTLIAQGFKSAGKTTQRRTSKSD